MADPALESPELWPIGDVPIIAGLVRDGCSVLWNFPSEQSAQLKRSHVRPPKVQETGASVIGLMIKTYFAPCDKVGYIYKVLSGYCTVLCVFQYWL